MSRALLLSAVVGMVLAGLGCRHVGGQCDCTNDPSAAVRTPAANPYPVVGQGAAPAALPESGR